MELVLAGRNGHPAAPRLSAAPAWLVLEKRATMFGRDHGPRSEEPNAPEINAGYAALRPRDQWGDCVRSDRLCVGDRGSRDLLGCRSVDALPGRQISAMTRC